MIGLTTNWKQMNYQNSPPEKMTTHLYRSVLFHLHGWRFKYDDDRNHACDWPES